MNRAYGTLTGKPWGMRPWEIARLTDHQIIHLYVLPESRRRESENRAMKNLPPLPDELDAIEAEERGVPDQRFMLSVMVGMLGMSKEAALEELTKQAAMNAKGK